MENIRVEHWGSRITKVSFRDEFKRTIRISVWLSSECTFANSTTSFNHSVEVKGFKCRKFEFKYCSNTSTDNRYGEYITEQQLYEAYHIHWDKLNPIRIFSKGQFNGDIVISDDIKRINTTINHKAY